MSERLTPEEQQTLSKTILEANEQGWGIALGLLLGVGLLVATNVLVIKGGAYVGWHLRLHALRPRRDSQSVCWSQLTCTP